MPKYPNMGKDQSLLPASHLFSATLSFDMIDAASAGGRFLSIFLSAAASKNPKADTLVPC